MESFTSTRTAKIADRCNRLNFQAPVYSNTPVTSTEDVSFNTTYRQRKKRKWAGHINGAFDFHKGREISVQNT